MIGNTPAGANLRGFILPNRAGFYVDGFNVHGGLDEFGAPHLKWLNLRLLCQKLAGENGHMVERVVYCTARPRHFANAARIHRWGEYKSALEIVGCEPVLGTFALADINCRAKCRETFQKAEEKQSDVNLAIMPIEDLFDQRIDHVYLVTGDSDQIPTLRHIATRYPDCERIVVFPPNRGGSSALAQAAIKIRHLSREDIASCLFPEVVRLPGDRRYATRPHEYAPPG
ncbi:NYN domain-containing protein [Hyphobacterium marinum]|uniref:NYN domain-containing protein n=1 Tax=Hyphobacterium marinum TaxID=3116574 RepID=A0ABU7M0M6_9PROT|nr:NYN domain-containing protein [Hyphobacterium sp. Y6023]MEE2567353.1 NYN domain-containing protein [Hyphobacterium sp. Y6023]